MPSSQLDSILVTGLGFDSSSTLRPAQRPLVLVVAILLSPPVIFGLYALAWDVGVALAGLSQATRSSRVSACSHLISGCDGPGTPGPRARPPPPVQCLLTGRRWPALCSRLSYLGARSPRPRRGVLATPRPGRAHLAPVGARQPRPRWGVIASPSLGRDCRALFSIYAVIFTHVSLYLAWQLSPPSVCPPRVAILRFGVLGQRPSH